MPGLGGSQNGHPGNLPCAVALVQKFIISGDFSNLMSPGSRKAQSKETKTTVEPEMPVEQDPVLCVGGSAWPRISRSPRLQRPKRPQSHSLWWFSSLRSRGSPPRPRQPQSGCQRRPKRSAQDGAYAARTPWLTCLGILNTGGRLKTRIPNETIF